MKKVIFVLSVLLLSSCGTSEPAENHNAPLSTLPSFVDLNSNMDPFTVNQNAYNEEDRENKNGNVLDQGNMNIGTSENSNSTAHVAPAIDLSLLIPQEGPFDCQSLSIYEQMSFYPSFLQHFESLYRYSSTDITTMLVNAVSEESKKEISGKTTMRETRDNITSSCLSKDQRLFIVLAEGDQGGYGFKIVRYQLGRDLLEIAQREDAQFGLTWPFTPVTFGRRTGKILSMPVHGTKDNSTQTIGYAYDYVSNYIRVNEYCSTQSGKKTCGSYPYTK